MLELKPVHSGPSAEDVERARFEQSSFSATTIERGRFNVDLGTGHPFFGFLRLVAGVGRLYHKGALDLGLDIGVELRTNTTTTTTTRT